MADVRLIVSFRVPEERADEFEGLDNEFVQAILGLAKAYGVSVIGTVGPSK